MKQNNGTLKWGNKMVVTFISETPEKICVMTLSGALIWLGKCTWKVVDGAIVPVYA